MNKRFLVITRERGGSNFFISLLLGASGRYDDRFCGYVNQPEIWLRTIPSKQCKIIYEARLNQNIGFKEYVAAYEPEVPELFFHVNERVINNKKKFYNSLPGDWKFIFLFRHPSSHITSWYRRRLNQLGRQSSSISDISKSEDIKSWHYLCNRYVVNGCRSVTEKLDDDRFLLVKFEDMVDKPFDLMVRCFDHMNFTLDEKFYSNFISNKVGDREKGSSFKKQNPSKEGDFWSEEQYSIFLKYISEDFLKLYPQPEREDYISL